MYRFLITLLLPALFSMALAAEELAVLDGKVNGAPAHEMMCHYLNGLAKTCFEKRTKAYEAVKSADDVKAYQERMRAFFTQQLGGFPDRSPLNAQIVGGETRDGFRYEKVIYESHPGVYVTAALFLPLTEPPYPGVLVPCGHSNNGKASDAYQRACILLAKHGMAALIYDPVGQGERYYYLKEDGSPLFGTTLQHTVMGVGSILTGTNTAMYRIYDGMRGIDYLVSRSEIDPERIGCTGNSGGGTLTSYIMALDRRVTCAAPSCYLTSFERLLETIAPQDAEQNIYAQVAYGMDHAEYIIMRAPKPTLVCAATHDFFDISGTWDTYRQAKRIYTRLGFAERVDLIEVDDKHGFSQARREAAVAWMRRWLLGIDAPVHEDDCTILTEAEIQCTPKGEAIWLEGARSVPELNIERETRLASERQAFWRDTPRKKALDKVREIIAVREFSAVPQPDADTVAVVEKADYTIEKLAIRPEPGIVLPALAFVPKNASANAVLYCHGSSKEKDAKSKGPIEELVRQGKVVLAVDLRGIGETETEEKSTEWRLYVGPEWRDYFRAYLVGKSYVGMRTEDIWACAKYLRARLGKGTTLELVAIGEATAPALHAAALEAGLFASTALDGGIPSWSGVVQTPRARDQLVNAVHGALIYYDLPDLVRTIDDACITVQNETLPEF